MLQIDDAAYAAGINADRQLTSARSEIVRKRLDELADNERTKLLFADIDAAGAKFRDVRNDLVKRKTAGGTVSGGDIQKVLRPAADAYGQAVDQLALYQKQRVDEAREAASKSEHAGICAATGGVDGHGAPERDRCAPCG